MLLDNILLGMKQIFITLSILITLIFPLKSLALGDYTYIKIPSHKHNEASYQQAWCSMHNGITEYENSDKTRVDCLTATHAVEFDFSNKWAESVGQALHYGVMTGKKPMVVLILENPKHQKVYYDRVLRLSKIYNFDVEYVTNDILKLDKDGKCPYKDCKCHRVKK